MAFDLEITIAGMCLLVRDLDASGNPHMLHVLLPAMPTTGMHAHDARLLFLKRYTDSQAGAVEKEEISLNKKSLDLSDLTSSNPLNLDIHPPVFDFGSGSSSRRVSRTLLDGALPRDLCFRMKLSHGDMVGHLPGGFWRVDEGTPRRIATAIKWRLADVDQKELKLDFGDGTSRTLHPVREGSQLKMRLFLLQLPPSEFPGEIPDELPGPRKPPPVMGTDAHHFSHYYPLLYPRPTHKLKFHRDGGERPNSNGEKRGSELTCMVATAPAEVKGPMSDSLSSSKDV